MTATTTRQMKRTAAGRVRKGILRELDWRRGAAERITFNRENTSRARKSPALGVRGAPGVKRGLGGTSGPFCAAF
jgi:hypothetical protein